MRLSNASFKRAAGKQNDTPNRSRMYRSEESDSMNYQFLATSVTRSIVQCNLVTEISHEPPAAVVTSYMSW